MNDACLAFGLPGNIEWIIIIVIALLIFGKRLPDVARSVGKSIVEFKKGIREVHTEIEDQSHRDDARSDRLEHKSDSSVKNDSARKAGSAKTSDETSNASH
jgi:sec-independent protein translocase protein TatA